MHALLRERLWRKLESMPDERVYQVLDYVEFLESKYAPVPSAASGARGLAERFEDTMRARRVASSVISGTMEVVGVAARMVDGVADVGRAFVTGQPSSPQSQPPSATPQPTLPAGGSE
jgi:hypothetical protein